MAGRKQTSLEAEEAGLRKHFGQELGPTGIREVGYEKMEIRGRVGVWICFARNLRRT